jgi:hypothetical protein
VTIRPGWSWGSAGPLDASAPVFGDEVSARRHVQRRFALLAREAVGAGSLGEIGLLAGDLHRTLGSPRRTETDLREGRGVRFPVDVGVARIDGADHVFLTHLVAHPRRRLRWWSARTIAVMNGAFVGDLYLGPRAHPNDGRLDVTDGRLPPGQRRRGRRRARSGTHVPHPDLTTKRVRTLDLVVPPSARMHVWLDGEHVGDASTLSVRCVADALVVVA